MPLPLPLLTRSWRRAGVGTAALALAAAALTASGAAAGPTASGATASSTVAPPAVACLSAAPDHRVRVGSSLGVDPNSVDAAQTRAAQRSLEARSVNRRARAATTPASTRIDVYVHVIAKSNGKGGVSTKRIKQQIAVLNTAYAGGTSASSTSTPFTFKLKKITRTKKTSWYNWRTPTPYSVGDDVAPKKKLHRGDWGDLNLYLAKPSDGVLGYSSFPWQTSLKRDGVVVLSSSLPGGSATGYNQGDTATHEVGHWLGLFHTFENGCSPTGDEVADTPAQADGENVFSCDETSDTCAAPGLDPVHNFMSYGDDACLDRFTPGQVARMTQTWQAYRAPAAQS